MTGIARSDRERVVDTVAALTPDLGAFVSELVQQRSVLGNEASAQALVREQLEEEMGWDVQELSATDVDGIRDHPEFSETGEPYEDRPNLYAERPGTGDGRSLLLNGHVDVVPEGDADQWSFDPFGGLIEDGRIHGRGASDMKGGVGAMLFALQALEQAGIELTGDVAVETVIEEEAGGFGGSLATALAGPAATGGYDAVLIPEPTDFDMWIANDGVSYFRVTVEGKGAHAAETDNGVNAAAKLLPIFDALGDLHDERKTTIHDPLFEQWHEHTVSLNRGSLHAGDWPSSVPDEATLECRISHAPSETRAEIHEVVEQTVEDAAAGDDWLDDHPPTVDWFGWRGSSAKISPEEPIVETVQSVMTDHFDADSAAKGFPGGIDTRFFVNYADTPALCFGPSANNIHGTDEYVDLADLERTTTAYALLMMEWCGYEVAE